MPEINADRRMLRRCNTDELHDSKRRRALCLSEAFSDAFSTTESGTVGKTAGAVETRRSAHAAQKDGTDYVDVSRANGSMVCRVRLDAPLNRRATSNADVQTAAVHPEANAPHRKQTQRVIQHGCISKRDVTQPPA
jgi:hypothetical protein